MAGLGVDEIAKLLREMGYAPRAIDAKTLRCAVPTAAGEVRLVLRHAGTWLYLGVLPFLEAGSTAPWGAGKYPPRFLGRILAVNHNLVLVKFAVDDDGDLCLRAELPTESLQRREIETAVHLLVNTTEQYRLPIRDALLDAGRATERPSVLPEPPRSEPPPADLATPRSVRDDDDGPEVIDTHPGDPGLGEALAKTDDVGPSEPEPPASARTDAE